MAAGVIAAKSLPPFPRSSVHGCVCVPVFVCESVCGMLWFLAGAKFSPSQ